MWGIQAYDVPGFNAKIVHLCQFWEKMRTTTYDPVAMRNMIRILQKN